MKQRFAQTRRLCGHAAVVLVGVLVLSSPSLGGEAKDWARASQVDTVEAYEEFVRNHPKSRHGSEARARARKLEGTATDPKDAVRKILAAPVGALERYSTLGKSLLEHGPPAVSELLLALDTVEPASRGNLALALRLFGATADYCGIFSTRELRSCQFRS